MTTKKTGGKKFKALKSVLTKNKGMSAADVIEAVQKQFGLTVSTTYIQRVKQHIAGKLPPSIKAKSAPTVPSEPPAPTAVVPAPTILNIEALLRVKQVAAEFGGVENLIQLATTLQKVAA